jgi:predicted regulator of Ras-like GTPase activity (Roadblock/LC7/MglB family)
LGLFDVFKASKTRQQQRAPTAEGKTPLAVATEVQRLVDKKCMVEALALAEQGVYQYARSEACLSLFRFLKRESLASQIAELRHKVEREPSPLVYARLADTYKEIGDFDKAIDLCNKGIELYPDHEAGWIILGKIRLERFKEDFLPRDALLAIEYFERAFELNRSSYKTLLELAELFTDVGAKRRARRKLDAIFEFAPDDEKALALRQKVESLPDARREDLDELVKEHAEKRLKAATRRGRKAGETLSPAARLAKNPMQLRERLESLRALEGLAAAVAMDAQGAVLASFAARDLDEKVVSEAVQQAFAAAEACSLRMDIGHFKKGLFEGPSGYVYLLVFEEIRIAILCEPATKLDRLEETATRLVEHELYR